VILIYTKKVPELPTEKKPILGVAISSLNNKKHRDQHTKTGDLQNPEVPRTGDMWVKTQPTSHLTEEEVTTPGKVTQIWMKVLPDHLIEKATGVGNLLV
jgi:hypothetical protein